MIQNVANYISENIVELRQGVNFFIGNMPENAKTAVCIYHTGGQPPEQEVPVDYPTFQFLIRSNKYAEAERISNALYRLLNRDMNFLIDDIPVMYTRAIALPQSLGGVDDKNRFTFSLNIQMKVKIL